MALQAAYTQFLEAPTSAALTADASLHYITTTTSHVGATDIIKHLASLRNHVKKERQDVISAVESRNALAAEVDTVLQLVTSGGPYLPGLDDNFLADRTVALPIVSAPRLYVSFPVSVLHREADKTTVFAPCKRCTSSPLTPQAKSPRSANPGTRALS